MTHDDDWPIIRLTPGPTDAELEAERDDKYNAEVAFEAGVTHRCLAPAPQRYGAFGVWPRCALVRHHTGLHSTSYGETWEAS